MMCVRSFDQEEESLLFVTKHGMVKRTQLGFENGGKPVTTLEVMGNTRRSGTVVHFKPDRSMFSTTTYKLKIGTMTAGQRLYD